MKIAIAQTEIQFEQQEKNLALATEWIRQAVANQADCILFPEMSFTGFSMHGIKLAAMAPEAIASMRTLASANKIAIGFGYVAAAPIAKAKYENHYMICDQHGHTILDYTKIHPFSYCHEDDYYCGGVDIPTALLAQIPVSTLICYDLRFPEVFRLAAKNAALIIVPANWLARRSAHFSLLLRARAIENQVYVLGINCTGVQGENRFLGGSCLVNPEGEILTQCGDQPELRYAELTDDTASYRKAFPVQQDAKKLWYAQQYQRYFAPES